MNNKNTELHQMRKEWCKLAQKYSHLLGNDFHFYATFFKSGKWNLESKKNSKHKKTEMFRVVFNDGRTILSTFKPNKNGNHVLANFIIEVGIERVIELKIITVGGRNLLSNNVTSIIEQNPLSVGNEWYVITKIPNPEKIRIIEQIIENLKLSAHVELC